MNVDTFRASLRVWGMRYTSPLEGGAELWTDRTHQYFIRIGNLEELSPAERYDYLAALAETLGEVIPKSVAA